MAQAWEYDGIDLTRHGYNVSISGAPLNTPARRGENVVIPHKTGRVYVEKWPDQRLVTLTMWVRDIPAGGGSSSEANMLANLDVLRGLFAQPGQHTLKHQFGSTTRMAQAEVVSTVDFKPEGLNNVYRFQVEFLLSDPWWYSESASRVGPTEIVSNPQNITVVNAGTYRIEDAVITLSAEALTGQMLNPTLMVGSFSLTYTGNIAAGKTLVIDCGAYTAKLDGVDVTGEVTHAGGVVWLAFDPGTNSLAVSCTTVSDATVQVDFTAPFV